MSLQFILGGSGSGKTRLLYNNLIRLSIENPDQQYIAVVPEQFTMQTQKEIVRLHPRHGVMNIDIVSFQRLAYRVFEELAVINPPVLDDMGKSMVLRKVASDKKRSLGMFKSHLSKNGFINQLKSMISELYQYGVSPEVLDQLAADAKSPLLCQKLTDLSVIYKGFKEFIADHYITTEEVLDVLCRVLPDSELVKNSIITLDGYTGFTPVQYRLIELFLKYSKQVIIAVTIDPKANPYQEGKRHELFYMSKHTICRLIDLAASCGVSHLKDIILNSHPAARYHGEKALDFMEQNLYRYTGRSYHEEQEQIYISQSMNPSEEVLNVVRQIHSLVRQGLRYRDIAVITGDMAGYSKEMIHQFQQEGIPYFLDDKKSILLNPMVELLRAALEVVQKDFDDESMFRYLKTRLVSEDMEESDRLENYVMALGIRGYKRWNSTWDWLYRGGKNVNLAELNQLREQILTPLKGLREAMLQDGATIKSITEAVVLFLEACHVEEKLKSYESYFLQMGEHNLVKEYNQVYGLVMDLLDRIVNLLGDETVSKKEYAQILDAGFAEIKVGVIPATVDRIVIGDITRTRLDHVKVLFFVGVNEGVVPVRKENGSLLSDMDRTFFNSRQVELAPTSKEEGFMQRFYLYLIMTKPEKKLILSYTLTDSSGKSMRPSSLIGEVRKLYPKLSVIKDRDNMDIYSLRDAKQRLIEGLQAYGEAEADNAFLELYRWFFQSEAYRGKVKQLVHAAFYCYEKRGIGKAAAKALYGPVLSGSVTRLEQYAACAYAHFLNYGLELTKRQEYELAAVDIGNLFHYSIDLCFKEMKERGGKWSELTDEKRKSLVTYCVQKVAEDYGNTILKSSARNSYLVKRVERITDRTLWALAEQIKKGDFEPAGFEVSFSALDNLKAMKIPLSETESLHLKGRVDRLDLYEEEEQIYIKIIDYKSGGTSFDLSALYYGLQLQLVVYMDAVLEMEERKHPDKRILPAGIFYYNINDPLVDKKSGLTPEGINRQILKALKMNGLVNSSLEVISHLDREIETESDVIPVALKNGLIQEARSSVAGEKRFQALRRYVNDKLRCEGRQILDGEITVNPYKQGSQTACDYCPYHSVCGFDLKTSGYGYRRFKSLKSEEIWPEIEQMDSNEEETDEEGGRKDGN